MAFEIFWGLLLGIGVSFFNQFITVFYLIVRGEQDTPKVVGRKMTLVYIVRYFVVALTLFALRYHLPALISAGISMTIVQKIWFIRIISRREGRGKKGGTWFSFVSYFWPQGK